MNQLITSNQSLTMSSREIAELTGKEHSNVLADVRTQFAELYDIEKDDCNFNDKLKQHLSIEFDNRGYMSVVNLDREQTYTLIAGYSVKLRNVIIKRWQELEAKNNKPLTRKEMALMVIAQEEEIERLQIELDQSKQWLTIKKVAAHNNVNWKSLEWRKLKEISIVIGLLPRKIFDSNFYDGVNVYHKDAWKIVYPTLDLPNGEC